MEDLQLYFSGEKLYGDDFNLKQIEEWYNDEKEGYSNLGSNNKETYSYRYFLLDEFVFYKRLPKNIKFKTALGIGSAYGHEFLPISNQIENLYILEPSENLRSKDLNGLIPKYVDPSLSGKMEFEDNTFDLIVCFSVLHHIPNVSYLLKEIYRCLKPNGYLLLREPIHSMGDWRFPRKGLTKRERGISLKFFKENIDKIGYKIEYQELGMCMTSFLQRTIGKKMKKQLLEYPPYLYIDRFMSRIFSKNVHYHPQSIFQRISPTSIYYILKK